MSQRKNSRVVLNNLLTVEGTTKIYSIVTWKNSIGNNKYQERENILFFIHSLPRRRKKQKIRPLKKNWNVTKRYGLRDTMTILSILTQKFAQVWVSDFLKEFYDAMIYF